MSNECIVRPYQLGDEKGIVDLLELVFDGWPHFDLNCSPLDHLKWKLNSPLGIRNTYVVEYDSQIVATEGRIPVRIKINDKIIRGEQRVDLAVHPDFRGKGFFKKINDKLFESSSKLGIELSYAIESNPIVISRMKKKGAFFFDNRIIDFFYIFDIKKFIKHYKKRSYFYNIPLKLLIDINKIRYSFSNKEINSHGWEIKDIKKFNNKINKFWLEISNKYNFIIERDVDYLNWRYCDTRSGSFIIKTAMENDEVIGYIILRINQMNKSYHIGYIVDLIAIPGREDVVNSLVHDSLRHFKNAMVNEVRCWSSSNHPNATVLKKNGFIDIKQNILISFIPLSLENNFFFDKKDLLYVSMGDSDHI